MCVESTNVGLFVFERTVLAFWHYVKTNKLVANTNLISEKQTDIFPCNDV